MKPICQRSFTSRALAFFALLAVTASVANSRARTPRGFSEQTAAANGTEIHYFRGGSGPAVVLLHGYTQSSRMWFPLMPVLARHHTVIVPDLRGAGDSAKPDQGYDKKNMARDIHELLGSLGIPRAALVGHDVGLMVAYAYAAQFPAETDRVVLMDAFLPGIGEWNSSSLLADKWHFNFYGPTPLALVKGRERIYLEHFWNDFAADSQHSIPDRDRRFYTRQYKRPNAMRAGFEWFHNFEQDARDFAQFGKTPLTMPLLVLSGEKASGSFLQNQARLVATKVDSQIFPGAGHWLMEEATEPVIRAITQFLDSAVEGASVPAVHLP